MNKRIVILTSSVLILLSLYLPTNQPIGEVRSFYTPIDDYIPLETTLVIPYISYFFFLIFSYIYFLNQKNTKVLEQTLVALNIIIVASYAFYFLFQNTIDRPIIKPHHIFDHIYLWINAQVAPYNAFPSLHVGISVTCLYGLKLLKTRWLPYLTLWVVLIIFSTVFTKQHYFLDIIGGLGFAYISFAIAKRFIK